MTSKETSAPRRELGYIHLLRILTAFAVVFAHVSHRLLQTLPVGSADWTVQTVVNGLMRWPVPVFLMISGALLLDLGKTLSWKKLFGVYFVRIAVSLAFWSAVYAVFYEGVYHHGGLRAMWDYFWEGPAHLWYLRMLLGLYLVTPLLRKLLESRTLSRYFVALWAFYSVVLILFVNLGILPRTTNWLLRLDLHLPLGYAGFYVLGALIATTEIRPWMLRGSLIAAPIAFAISVWLGVAWADVTVWLFDFFSPFIVIESAAIFLLARAAWEEKRVAPFTKRLAGCCFGVYLMHQLFIGFMCRFCGLGPDRIPPLLSLLALSLTSFALSALATAVIQKIPKLGKMLV